jgi:hypothetical protein
MYLLQGPLMALSYGSRTLEFLGDVPPRCLFVYFRYLHPEARRGAAQ